MNSDIMRAPKLLSAVFSNLIIKTSLLTGALIIMGTTNGALAQDSSSVLSSASQSWAASAPPSQNFQARINLTIDNPTPVRGGNFTIGVSQEISPGWHSYAPYAGDAGNGLNAQWELPSFITTGPAHWPIAERFITADIVSFGYKDNVTALFPFSVATDAPLGKQNIKLSIVNLVCSTICIPEISEHTFSVNITDGTNVGGIDNILAAENATNNLRHDPVFISQKKSAMPATINSNEPILVTKNALILPQVQPEGSAPLTLSQPQDILIIPHEWGLIESLADPTILEDGRLAIQKGSQFDPARTELALMIRTPQNAYHLNAPVEYQPDVIAALNAPNIANHTAPIDTKNTSLKPLNEEVSSVRSNNSNTHSLNIMTALLYAFLGGVILNLMPCVFPVLFMKALSLSQLTNASQRDIHLHAWLYLLGILTSFSVLGIILLALKFAGMSLGWGFQLQSPIITAGLAIIFILIGLNLLDVVRFEKLTSRLSNLGQSKLSQSEGHSQSFLLGALATIVATPCTAPFMAAAMGFALLQPPQISLLILIMMGCGLGAPYMALSYSKTLRRLLPRPGAWMDLFRKIFAVPMFLTAVWLIWVAAQQIMAPSEKLRINATATSYNTSITNAGSVAASPTDSQDNTLTKARAHAFSPALLDELLSGDDPVFVNMTADWCITCKVNERFVLAPYKMKDSKLNYIVGDWTRADSSITAYLHSFSRQGVPLYVYYPARSKSTLTRPEPIILPQILTRKQLDEVFGE
jgi:thiol:disulfide interchange protein/DsbC/DsbD-like thiol-disulfide interchange protein